MPGRLVVHDPIVVHKPSIYQSLQPPKQPQRNSLFILIVLLLSQRAPTAKRWLQVEKKKKKEGCSWAGLGGRGDYLLVLMQIQCPIID